MFRSLRSWLARPAHKPSPRRRKAGPRLECLEDRMAPTIDITGGVVTLTGTSGTDRFMLRLKAGDAATLQVSDNNGTSFTDVALASVTSITVNGQGGHDTLIVDLSNGLIVPSSGNLALTFNGGAGPDRVIVRGNAGATLNETYTAGTTAGNATLKLAGTSASLTMTLNSVASVQDLANAQSLTINATDQANFLHVGAGPTVNGTATNVVRGAGGAGRFLPEHALGGEDDDEGQDDNGETDELGDDLDGRRLQDVTGAAFVPIAFGNVANVTVNGLGGNDVFLLTARHAAAGLQNLTLDGGAGTNVLVGRTTVPGVNVSLLNIQTLRDTGNEMLVSKLFLNLLGRIPAQSEIDIWAGNISRLGVLAAAQAIRNSLEGRTFLVRQWYERFLDRLPGNGEDNGWITALQNGAREEQLLAAFFSSDEFFNRAQSLVSTGTPNQRFVTALYEILLDRVPSAGEVNAAAAALALPQGRALLAQGFVLSPEFRGDLIRSLYLTFLDRDPSGAEVSGWLNSGLPLPAIEAAFLASLEFAL